MSKASTNVPVTHGRLTIHLPAGWHDESTVTFVAPVAQGLAAPLTGKKAPAYASNVNVTIEGLPDGVDDPQAFLQAMGDALREAGASIDDVRIEAFQMGGRTGALAERKVALGGQAIRQYTAVVFIERNVIVASASTSESEAAKERKTLLGILENVYFS